MHFLLYRTCVIFMSPFRFHWRFLCFEISPVYFQPSFRVPTFLKRQQKPPRHLTLHAALPSGQCPYGADAEGVAVYWGNLSLVFTDAIQRSLLLMVQKSGKNQLILRISDMFCKDFISNRWRRISSIIFTSE